MHEQSRTRGLSSLETGDTARVRCACEDVYLREMARIVDEFVLDQVPGGKAARPYYWTVVDRSATAEGAGPNRSRGLTARHSRGSRDNGEMECGM
jgi:hypothetical protein